MTATSDRRAVLVAGANGGMGRFIVRDLSRDSDVYALCRNASQLADAEFDSDVTVLEGDLTDFDSFEAISARIPRLDALIHAHAISERWAVADADADAWQRHLEVNVMSPALLTRALLPQLRASQGQVVFLNSGAGMKSFPGHAVYSATKFALHAVADALRGEEEVNRVRVSTVSPGPTATPMAVRDSIRTGHPMTPGDRIDPASVAAAVRLVVDATPDAQITQVSVRPRVELI